MRTNLYFISSQDNNMIYPKTHIFNLKNHCEAIYTYIHFSHALCTRNTKLMHLGYLEDGVFEIFDKPILMCDFTGIPDFIQSIDFKEETHFTKDNLMFGYSYVFDIILAIEQKNNIYNDISNNINNFSVDEINSKFSKVADLNKIISGGNNYDNKF